jgi:hypothetical protein
MPVLGDREEASVAYSSSLASKLRHCGPPIAASIDLVLSDYRNW